MPFTLSHAAAAGAFKPVLGRDRLPLAALAIGTMSPDFEYFLHLEPLALLGHSPLGLVIFCLPAGLIVLAAWELVAREPVRHLLGFPDEPAAAAPRASRWWMRAALAVLLGAMTHVLWDGMTHEGEWPASRLPALLRTAVMLRGHPVSWAAVVDYLSTFIGLGIVLGWLYREMRRSGAFDVLARSGWRRALLATLAVVALALGLVNAALRGEPATDLPSGEVWVGRLAVGAMLAFSASLFVYSLIRRASRTRAGSAG